MTPPNTTKKFHAKNPNFIHFYFRFFTLNLVPQFLHTHKCSVRTSPAPSIPNKAPRIDANGVQQGAQHKQVGKLDIVHKELPKHIFSPLAPCPFTSATTCKSVEPHFIHFIPPLFFEGDDVIGKLALLVNFAPQYLQKAEPSFISFPH